MSDAPGLVSGRPLAQNGQASGSKASTLRARVGRWDIVAEVRADSLQEIDLVLNRLRQIPGVLSTETSLLLSTHKL